MCCRTFALNYTFQEELNTFLNRWNPAFSLSVSMGIVLSRNHTSASLDELVRIADSALLTAKEKRKSRGESL